MTLIGNSIWNRYKKIIDDVHEDFNQDIITWKRNLPTTVNFFNEQENQEYTSIDLRVLVGYNYFRTWPITRHNEQGESDNQNMIIMINRSYLSRLGYLTEKGYFDFKPDKDYFFHRGIKYKSEGDTLLSQAKDTPLFIQLVLRREELLSGEDQFKQV